MIPKQQSMISSPYMDIYDLVVPKDNMLRQINDLVDFSFIYDELIDTYCLNNGRNAIRCDLLLDKGKRGFTTKLA